VNLQIRLIRGCRCSEFSAARSTATTLWNVVRKCWTSPSLVSLQLLLINAAAMIQVMKVNITQIIIHYFSTIIGLSIAHPIELEFDLRRGFVDSFVGSRRFRSMKTMPCSMVLWHALLCRFDSWSSSIVQGLNFGELKLQSGSSGAVDQYEGTANSDKNNESRARHNKVVLPQFLACWKLQ